MKNLDTEKMKAAYPTPPESFHDAVTGALDSLEDKKTLKFTKRKTAIRIAAACAAVAAIGTFTVAAAATNFFGLVATKKGTYGLTVTVDNGSAVEFEYSSMNLKFGYLPEGYVNNCDHPSWFEYRNGDEYFTSYVQNTDSFEQDLLNVVDTQETEYDGHRTLFVTFKEAENTDKLEYASFKYFDKYNCLVRCSGSDLEELKKITESIDTEPAPEDQKPADERDDKNFYNNDSAIVDYHRSGDGFRDEFMAGRVKEAKLGESIKLKTADYDKDTANITAKVTYIRKQDNIDGLDKKWFTDLGLETTFGLFFNPDGTLKKEKTERQYTGYDEDHLGTATDVTYNSNFYVAAIEIAAQDDIDDLNRVFTTDAFMAEGRNYYSYMTENGEKSAIQIYRTKQSERLSLKKGETAVIKVGIIMATEASENDAADIAYLAVCAVDATDDIYQNYMIKVKE